MGGSSVRIGDVNLWIDEQGEGMPLLCISGLGYSNWCWRETVEAFSRTHRVITFDNRGTGRSDVPEAGYSIEQFAADAAAILNRLDAAPAHVVGHSMGGYIALTLAARRPELVRSLVLIGTSSGGEGSLPVPSETSEAWKASVNLPPRDFARATMPYSFATGWADAHPQRFENLFAERVAFPTPTAVWKHQFRAAGAFGRDGLDATSVEIPALVVHGTDDRVVPYENGARLARHLPNARLETWAGAGHLCFLEEPDRFQSLLTNWLEQRHPAP